MLLLAIVACGPKKDPDAEANAKASARLATARARADSVRKARHVADSLELVRFASCSDSVTVALKKTAVGRRKLKAPLAVGTTLPEIATACGPASAKTPALAVGSKADSVKPPAAKPDSAKSSKADSAKRTAARADSLKVTAAAATPSVKRPAAVPAPAQPNPAIAAAAAAAKAADSVRADSLQRAHETQVLRENFAYGGGARDPFISLIRQKNAGPTIADLQLVGIYEDLRYAANSVAVLREKDGGKRHKLRVGDQIGRLKVAQIRPKDVVFAVEDFGFERQETLSLRKQEDVTP
jgi:hypothetical protein